MDVEVERVAELIGLGDVGPLVAHPEVVPPVPAHPVGVDGAEQLRQGIPTQPPKTGRGQLQATFLLFDQARLGEQLGDLGHPFQARRRLVAQQLAHAVQVHLVERAGLW